MAARVKEMEILAKDMQILYPAPPRVATHHPGEAAGSGSVLFPGQTPGWGWTPASTDVFTKAVDAIVYYIDD
jgi:hypothetical protein